MGKSIGEIFEQIRKAPTFEEKKKILLMHNIPVFRTYLRMAFDGSVRFKLPEGMPDIAIKERNIPIGYGETSLMYEAKKMYLFLEVDGVPAHPTLKQLKRESFFISLLESLDNQERELFKQLKEKKVDIGLSFEEINKIIPGLLNKPNDSKKVVEKKEEDSKGDKKETEEDSTEVKVTKEKPKKPRKTSTKKKDKKSKESQE